MNCAHGIPLNLICGACGPQPTGIDATLAERGLRYGSFAEHARITQAIKAAYQDSPNWARLPADMKEALEMNAHKVGRILNGDPLYIDGWRDAEGYLRLVTRRLEQTEGATDARVQVVRFSEGEWVDA